MNAAGTIAKVGVSLITIILILFIVLNCIPVNTSDSFINDPDISATVSDDKLSIDIDGHVELFNPMKKDITDIKLDIYTECDGIRTSIYSLNSFSLKSDTSTEIKIEGSIPILTMLMSMALNSLDTGNKIVLPMTIDFQAYYLDSMMGLKAHVDVDVIVAEAEGISLTGTGTPTTKLDLSVTNISKLDITLMPFEAIFGDNVNAKLDFQLETNSINFILETADAEGIVSSLREATDIDTGLKVECSGEIAYIDHTTADEMIDLIEIACETAEAST